MKLLRFTCNIVPNKMLQLQQCSHCILFNLKSKIISMESNNLPSVSKILPHPGFGVGRHHSFLDNGIFSNDVVGWAIRFRLNDSPRFIYKTINSYFHFFESIDHSIYIICAFTSRFFVASTGVPYVVMHHLILVQSLFSLSPSRLWAFVPVYVDFKPFDTL